MSKFLLSACAAAALLATLGATDALAATARASGAPRIYAGPGYGYAVIGQLARGEVVDLSECTPRGIWCQIVRDRGPNGWVLGSYLVGSAAKVNATPWRPLVDPFARPFHWRPFP